MPNPTRRHLALLILLLAWHPPAAADEPVTLDTLLARLAAIPERRATFTEQRRFAALDGTLDSSGRLLWRKGYLEKRTDWPQPERLEVDGDRVVVTAANDPPQVIDMNRAPQLRVLIDAIRGPLQGDAPALRRAFTPTAAGTLSAWTLDLAPRDPAAARFLRHVRLHGHDDQVDRLTITQANGDEQVMTITPR